MLQQLSKEKLGMFVDHCLYQLVTKEWHEEHSDLGASSDYDWFYSMPTFAELFNADISLIFLQAIKFLFTANNFQTDLFDQ